MKKGKGLVTVAIVAAVTTLTLAFTPFKNGKVVMVISLEVKNFTEWKKTFDAGAPVRDKAGIKVLSVCQSLDSENQVMVIEEAENAQSAHNFLELLKSKQKQGDMTKLDVKLYDKAE